MAPEAGWPTSPAPLIVTEAGAAAKTITHGPLPLTVAATPAAESAVSTSSAAAFQAMAPVVAASTLSVKLPPIALPAFTLYVLVGAGETLASATAITPAWVRLAGSIVTKTGATEKVTTHGPLPLTVAATPAAESAVSTSSAAAFQAMAPVVAASTLSVKLPPSALPALTLYTLAAETLASATARVWVSPAGSIVTAAGATVKVTTHGSTAEPLPLTVAATPAAESAVSTSSAAAFQAMAPVVAASTLSVKLPPSALPALTLNISGVAVAETLASATATVWVRPAGSIVTETGATEKVTTHGPLPLTVAATPAADERGFDVQRGCVPGDGAGGGCIYAEREAAAICAACADVVHAGCRNTRISY